MDANGSLLNAGNLFTYAAGTSTPQATYTDSTGLFANPNPIVLLTDGRVPLEIWLVDGLSYKFVLKDSLGNTIGIYDNLYGLAKTTAQENFNVKDFGAIGDGISDDSPAIQSAFNAVPATGGTVYFPDGKYRAHGLIPKPFTVCQLSGGAVLLADTAQNSLFLLQNSPLQVPTLSLLTTNNFAATVSSTTGMNAGDFIIVAAGQTYGAGPLEFNQIDTVSSGTILLMRNPAQIDYAGVGLTGASPHVYGLGANPIRNFRFTGGTISAYAAGGNNVIFSLQNVEQVEIDHVTFDGGAGASATGLGNGLIFGTNVSGLVFRNNWMKGERTLASFTAINVNALANSIIRDNILNVGNPFAGTYAVCLANHVYLQGGSWRNRIDSNLMYPIAFASVGAISAINYSFMNMIRGNQIYGNDPQVQIGTNLIAIDTVGSASVAAICGNVISGNLINDCLTGIKDNQISSVIKDNIISNFHLNASSVGIISNTTESLTPWYTNTFVNIQASVQRGSNPAGALLLGPTTFANVGTPANGTTVFVTDGTSGSNPLTGGGTGCMAIRQNGAWKGL